MVTSAKKSNPDRAKKKNGTYGRITTKQHSSSSSIINNNNIMPSSNNKKKGKKLQPSATPKIKGRSTTKAITAAASSGKKKKKVNKEPPKSKHHSAKKKKKSTSSTINDIFVSSSSSSARKSKSSTSSISYKQQSDQYERNCRQPYPGKNAEKLAAHVKRTKKRAELRKKRDRSSISSSSSSTKTKKKPRQQKPKYRMTLPMGNDNMYLKQVNCPWYDATSAASNDNTQKQLHAQQKKSKSSSSSSIQLPSEQILTQLDTEMYNFGMYVKLTSMEQRARLAFLEHVTDISVGQFEGHGSYSNSAGNNNNNNNNSSNVSSSTRGQKRGRGNNNAPSSSSSSGNNNNNDHDGGGGGFEEMMIHVAPFGSFATQEVCTFASDVDMCLWGVVKGAASTMPSSISSTTTTTASSRATSAAAKGAEAAKRHAVFIGDEEGEDEEFVLENATGSNIGCPLLTESSLLRTMDAIQSAAATAAAATMPKDKDMKKPAALVKGDSLFFIDRVGEARDDDDDNTANNNNNVEVIDLCDESGAKSEEPQTVEKGIDNAADDKKADDTPVKATDGNAIPEPMDNKATIISASSKKDTAAAAASSNFQCVIDTKGAQELGGEVRDDLTSNQAEKNIMPEARQKTGTNKDRQSSVNGINDDDESDESEVIIVDNDKSDDDSADKMSSYYNRQHLEIGNIDVRDDNNLAPSNRPTASSPVILLDDDSSSDEEDLHDVHQQASSPQSNAVLELSITSNKPLDDDDEQPSSRIVRNAKKPSFGPTGKARTHCVSALLSLTRQLRRSSFTHTIECRSKARVPIINCSTRTGFEGDIAIGGHNGVDTSAYASSQVQRFISFAPIVLILKVLMAQQGLDKPFTGGLGSYKLYVLVAYHIDCHLANGGTDRPSEVLISLLIRYGCVGKKKHETTDLMQLKNREAYVSSDGGMCELTPTFRLGDCVNMFRECHGRLLDRISVMEDYHGGFDHGRISYLSSIIDCYRLREARETSNRRAKLWDNICRPTAYNDAGKVDPNRRVGMVFSKRGAVGDVKRSPRGTLIPKNRPDLQAKQSLRGNREAEVIQRGTKNRKNNKKQKRDTALKEFASSHY